MLFRSLRMGVDPPDPLPDCCPSCGSVSSVDHLLACRVGGWLTKRHGAYFVAAGFTEVIEEPFLPPLPIGAPVPATSTTMATDARADLAVRGFHRVGTNAYLDVTVIDTGAPWRGDTPSPELLTREEDKKIAKYAQRIYGDATFSPLACSVYGGMG